jgi:CO dehydrogenase/acetyl-CoA synthase delta subunit
LAKYKLEDLLELLKNYNVERLEDVKIEGDLEIEIEGSSGVDLSSLTALYTLLNEFRNFFYHTNMALNNARSSSTIPARPYGPGGSSSSTAACGSSGSGAKAS